MREMPMVEKKNLDKYIKRAKRLGALDAVVIRASDVVNDHRALLKCMYGCKGWGTGWTCPSRLKALMPWEFERILQRYKTALLIHCNEKKLSQKISYELERDAFLDGHYFAFSMSDCGLCQECSPKGCRFPMKARPAMQALGIDVYATARKQGLPIKTLKNMDEPQNWYSLVLID